MASPSTNMLTCLWNCFCFYTHNTVALKRPSRKITPMQDKSNLVARIWWSCRRAVDRASWLVEDWGWAIKAGPWNSYHTTNTSRWANIHYNSIVCRFCTSTERKGLAQLLLEIWSSLSRALSAVTLLQVWWFPRFTASLCHCFIMHLRTSKIAMSESPEVCYLSSTEAISTHSYNISACIKSSTEIFGLGTIAFTNLYLS